MKLQKYNQILLSILGTVILVFLIIGGGMALFSLYQDMTWQDDYEEVSIISDEKASELILDSLRKQLISFEELMLVDTAKEVFLIPVGQANLIDEEYIDDSGLNGLLNVYSGKGKRYYTSGDYFNNLLVWDKQNDVVEKLFSDRVSISDFVIFKYAEEVIITITAIKEDTNRDGFWTTQDLQQLYLYHIRAGQLIEVESNQMDFIKIDQLLPSEDFIVLFGHDWNNDGVFNSKREPMLFYELNIENGEIELLVDQKVLNGLQKRLEGQLQ